MDQVTRAEDAMGAAAGGAQGLGAPDVPRQEGVVLGGDGPRGLTDAVTAPGDGSDGRRQLSNDKNNNTTTTSPALLCVTTRPLESSGSVMVS